MPNRPRITLTKEELQRADIPLNHVLIELIYKSEGLKTKGGITVGFLEDTTLGDGSAHPADVAEIFGRVIKLPQKLYFNPEDQNNSMDWDCEMELQVGDIVWFSVLESKNAVEILCDEVLYRSVPYSDCYCAKREYTWQDVPDNETAEVIIPLNGFVLCRQCYMPQISPLDAISDTIIDKSRGTIAYLGKPVRAYLRPEYSDVSNLEVGDEVIFDPKAPLFLLERTKELAMFEDDNLFWVVLRRRIIFVNNK